AYFDFSDSATYHFNPSVIMPDGASSDTLEVAGSFPDANTMIGTMYSGKYPGRQLTFTVLRDGPASAPASLSTSESTGVIFPTGTSELSLNGVAYIPGGRTIPEEMTIATNFTSDQAFYAFVASKIEVRVVIRPNPGQQATAATTYDFNNIVYDQVGNM